jgi:Zn-dependent oligopeptidase
LFYSKAHVPIQCGEIHFSLSRVALLWAQVYEVRETVEGEDRLRAIFLHDNYSRQNKQSGAWMSELRAACPAQGTVPIILNNNNFAKGSEGAPTLLSFGMSPR